MRGDVVKLENAKCIKETDAALLCRLDDGTEIWFPKSHVDDDSEVYNDTDSAEGTLVVSEWIAKQKNLL